jgi:hypothetical protein
MHANPRSHRAAKLSRLRHDVLYRLDAFAHLAAATDEAHMRHCIAQLLKKTLTTF